MRHTITSAHDMYMAWLAYRGGATYHGQRESKPDMGTYAHMRCYLQILMYDPLLMYGRYTLQHLTPQIPYHGM